MASLATQCARFEDRSSIDVLVVSPNTRLRENLQEKLGHPRWNLLQASSGAEVLKILHSRGDDDCILLLDPSLPDLEAGEFQGIVRRRFPNAQILMLNSQTGQLLLGSASPTPVSKKIAEVINHGGSLHQVPLAVSPNDHAQPSLFKCDSAAKHGGQFQSDDAGLCPDADGCGSRYNRAGDWRERNRKGPDCAGDPPDQLRGEISPLSW